MAGSTFGNIFKITTWGESHGAGMGVVVDGVPAGLSLCEEDIQKLLNRRKPGQSRLSTPRKEQDKVEILSGTFEGKTTGTPISMMVHNLSQQSKDYSEIASCYRPGHADFTFDEKYGFRDYRGGGRSSGRETIGRVAAGAIAEKILSGLDIVVQAYITKIGGMIVNNGLLTEEITRRLEELSEQGDSAGGIIECKVLGLPAGLGTPVFEKLEANIGKALLSIGSVKGIEIGDGFRTADTLGSENNDSIYAEQNNGGFNVSFKSNHAGGILGGISTGAPLIVRTAIKPTPSIRKPQQTVNKNGELVELSVHGRHDPVIVPRAVVVVESMVALVLVDALFENMSARMDAVCDFYKGRRPSR